MIQNKIRILVLIAIVFLFLTIIVLYYQYLLSPQAITNIANIASQRYPKAEDMNKRFEKLYRRYGKGKSVPYKFVNGTNIVWKEIYYNMDYLVNSLTH